MIETGKSVKMVSQRTYIQRICVRKLMADAECLVASTLNLVCLVICLNLYLLTKIVNIEQGYMFNKALFNDDLCAEMIKLVGIHINVIS